MLAPYLPIVLLFALATLFALFSVSIAVHWAQALQPREARLL